MNSQVKSDCRNIAAIAGILTILSIIFKWDEQLAVALYNPVNEFSLWVRHYFQMPAIIVTLVSIVWLGVPKLKNKNNLARQAAIVWFMAMVLVAGLFVHVFVKETFERPRPRQTELLGGVAEYVTPFIPNKFTENIESGKSFVSGHTAMGIIFAVPFFVLRRKKPKTAKAFLVGGVTFGAVIGLGRMISGAHFFTDVLWSIAFMLMAGSAFSHYIKPTTNFKSRYLLGAITGILLVTVLFNSFTVTKVFSSENKNLEINLPCNEATLKYGEHMYITAYFEGYGSSKRNLKYMKLMEKLNLESGWGFTIALTVLWM